MSGTYVSNSASTIIGLDNGTIQHWDLKNSGRPVEQVRVAHTRSIMGMDWIEASGLYGGTTNGIDSGAGATSQRRGLGWLVTAGTDKTVKVG